MRGSQVLPKPKFGHPFLKTTLPTLLCATKFVFEDKPTSSRVEGGGTVSGAGSLRRYAGGKDNKISASVTKGPQPHIMRSINTISYRLPASSGSIK